METPYTVPEIARLTGIPETTLYDYVRQFSGVVPEMEALEENGRTRRRYPEQAIAVFQTIRHLKDRGVDAPTIRALLQESKATEDEVLDEAISEPVYVSYGGSEADAGTTAEAEAPETIAVDFPAGETEVREVPVDGAEVTAAASQTLPGIEEQVVLEFAPPILTTGEAFVEPVSPVVDASAAASNGATPGEEVQEVITHAVAITAAETSVSSPVETIQPPGPPAAESLAEREASLYAAGDPAPLVEAPFAHVSFLSQGSALFGLEPGSPPAAFVAETQPTPSAEEGTALPDLVSTSEATTESTVSSVEPDLLNLQGQLLGSLEAGLRGLRDLIDAQHARNNQLQSDLHQLQTENERLRVTVSNQKEQQRSVQHLLTVIKEQCEQGIRTVAE